LISAKTHTIEIVESVKSQKCNYFLFGVISTDHFDLIISYELDIFAIEY